MLSVCWSRRLQGSNGAAGCFDGRGLRLSAQYAALMRPTFDEACDYIKTFRAKFHFSNPYRFLIKTLLCRLFRSALLFAQFFKTVFPISESHLRPLSLCLEEHISAPQPVQVSQCVFHVFLL